MYNVYYIIVLRRSFVKMYYIHHFNLLNIDEQKRRVLTYVFIIYKNTVY